MNFTVVGLAKASCLAAAAFTASAAYAQSPVGDASTPIADPTTNSDFSSAMPSESIDHYAANLVDSDQPDGMITDQFTARDGHDRPSSGADAAGLVPEGRDFTFIVAPYVWIPTVTGDIGLGAQGIPLNLNAGDLLDVFEFGGLIRGEVRHKSGWGVSVDHIFADLGTGFDILIGDVDASIDAAITEVAVIRRIESGRDSFEPYAGIRHWNADVTAEIQSFFFNGTVEVGDKWTDPIVGLRYLHPMGERWRLIAQGDIGGFGAGSKFSWNAATGASYALSRRSQFQIVYRVLSVDRESPAIGGGSPVDLDLSISGPLIGFAYQF